MSRRKIKVSEEATEINISPMIDMVFILLIFFIVTTVFVDERGLDADKPVPSHNPVNGKNKEPFNLEILETGDVMLNGIKIGLGGVRSKVKARVAQEKEAPIVVKVHPTIRTSLMVRVMDEIKIAGAKKISVTELAD